MNAILVKHPTPWRYLDELGIIVDAAGHAVPWGHSQQIEFIVEAVNAYAFDYWNAIADQVLYESDDQLLENAIAEGIEVEVEAAKLRNLLLTALHRAKEGRS